MLPAPLQAVIRDAAPAGPPTPQCVVVALACPEATYLVNERIHIQDYNITINFYYARTKI